MKTKMTKADYQRLRYPIQIIKDETGGWFVQIPDLPGCMSVVERFEDAYREIESVKEGWLELALEDGQDIPLPSTEKKFSGKFSLRIPPSLHRRLVELSEAEGMSLNSYCLYLLSWGAGCGAARMDESADELRHPVKTHARA